MIFGHRCPQFPVPTVSRRASVTMDGSLLATPRWFVHPWCERCAEHLVLVRPRRADQTKGVLSSPEVHVGRHPCAWPCLRHYRSLGNLGFGAIVRWCFMIVYGERIRIRFLTAPGSNCSFSCSESCEYEVSVSREYLVCLLRASSHCTSKEHLRSPR
ncbi:hypothetical protein BU25DRAFT_252618 [Macroventuria anomochaeta]|uniref:Uncharacterized protein n=1 Tax=Macroventuria anomochaeta TaxID=301207 RepID=A0ACB6RGU8_9PLEO|nr:uncharacterized protein BU25DRAFT_252618 [Macroventuria anomochaeta]KAF2621171.1 hypothetical protein BU25DRAFT_252618 [Macroventuria anomochaeta]